MGTRVSVEDLRSLRHRFVKERAHITALSDGFSSDRDYLLRRLYYLEGFARGLAVLQFLVEGQSSDVSDFLVFLIQEQTKISWLLKDSK